MKRGVGAITIIALVAYVTGCATVNVIRRPEIQAVRPRVMGIDFQRVDLAFDVDVNNPYPMAIRTPEFRYGLDIEGTEFLSSEGFSKIDLPALKTGTVTLPVRLPYADLWRTFRNLADAPEVGYTLHGAVIASALGQWFEVPLKHSGTFPILRPPTLSDLKVQLSDVSLRGAKIITDAAMKNPNAFALGIRNLGYVLNIGDQQVGGLTASTAETIGAGKTGQLRLTGAVSASDALSKIIGGGISGAKVELSGSIETPYGQVQVSR